MPTVKKLSVSERLELTDRIWESMPETVESSDVPDWQIEILKERLAAASPGEGIPLEMFVKELRANHEPPGHRSLRRE